MTWCISCRIESAPSLYCEAASLSKHCSIGSLHAVDEQSKRLQLADQGSPHGIAATKHWLWGQSPSPHNFAIAELTEDII